ncbi:MAG TPA: hypothetical protein VNT28_01990 [Candidatus Limnocylindrales bacterium]|jgi:hypothetical protein|nr:hypothetical protein [Candidatus Limnocylindrales bacterium]
MSTPIERLEWHRREAAALPHEPPLWRDPARLALVGSALLFIIGSLIPWATGTDGAGRDVAYHATAATGEGVVIIGAALLLVFLAHNRLMWETSSRLLQLLPLVVALLAAALWLSIENYAGQHMVDWEQLRGGDAALTVARYLYLAGIGLIVFSVAWLERQRPDDVRRHTRPLLAEIGVNRWSAISVVLTVLFGAAGASLAILSIIFVSGLEGLLPAVFLGIFGLFGGIAMGARLARWVERTARR